MNAQYYTYLHCKPDGTPFYVGKGKGRRSHVFKYGRNQHHKRVVSKYGRENIGIFVFYCESEQQALSDEVRMISQLRADGYVLCNVTNGGDGTSGYNHSEEAKLKMSKSKAGQPSPHRGKKLSEEFCKKMSESRKNNQGMIDRCRKMSAENALRKVSDITREKMRNAQLGRKLSEEAKLKVSLSKIGKPRPDLAERNRNRVYSKGVSL